MSMCRNVDPVVLVLYVKAVARRGSLNLSGSFHRQLAGVLLVTSWSILRLLPTIWPPSQSYIFLLYNVRATCVIVQLGLGHGITSTLLDCHLCLSHSTLITTTVTHHLLRCHTLGLNPCRITLLLLPPLRVITVRTLSHGMITTLSITTRLHLHPLHRRTGDRMNARHMPRTIVRQNSTTEFL